ncbi:hypothetical protein [Bacillus solitudinis]|uniref:hypothetical protein n=1 Tax=Bacillus solitudinis TaxID=2014074 RepID=UPI000C23B023|nr:hypothetical protein [Bacillus solitudinis]
MKIVTISYENWEKYRRPILNFVKRYDKSASQYVYKKLFKMKKHHLHEPGTCIKLTFWEGKIIAFAAVINYGTTFSSVLLSPRFKNTHLKTTLFASLIDELGVCYQKISYNDKETIKMALQAHLVCFSYTKTQDDQIYLWFGGGHWHSDDITQEA